MKISKISIRNFRGISEIDMDIDKDVNIIVGPNAVGKTTILEAVRLVKSVLTPRFFQETEQVLTSLGAMSPQHQLRGGYFDFPAIARDPSKEITLSIRIKINDAEISQLENNIPMLSMEMLRGQMGRTDDQGKLALTQFLSSVQGKETIKNLQKSVIERIQTLKNSKQLDLGLLITPGELHGQDQFSQVAFASLEQSLRPNESLMSYFPADRAFPSGEINIQIGPGEASAQIQSHIGMPQSKYHRLKQTIVNSILLNNVDQTKIKHDFELVFDELLPGKKLYGLSVSPVGLLKVSIQEESTGKIFDIDSMSSGEKGLILTFLLIRQTVSKSGIALIDEPELHLNPAVCKKLLPFLIDKITLPNDIQTIICTHSGELLGIAFERKDCNVFHLRTHNNATKIYERDYRELFEALKRLGTSTADALFANGNIYVEGEHDSTIIEEGFYDLTSGYKISSLGGRQEIEKEIKSLQQTETNGSLDKIQCFIFDLDNKPSDLKNSTYVKVSQWDRYCLENYLIEKKILFDQIKLNSTNPPDNRGDFDRKLKELAFEQKINFVVNSVYSPLEPDNPGFRQKEGKGKSYEEIADILVDRLINIAGQVHNIKKNVWVPSFLTKCEKIDKLTTSDWEDKWEKKCNGKDLIDALYREYKINLPKLEFKKKMISQMRLDKSDNWRVIESILRESLS